MNLSKDDMMNMICHDASHIFSNKEGELSDMDIDELLESGERRNMKQQERLAAMDESGLRVLAVNSIEESQLISSAGGTELDPEESDVQAALQLHGFREVLEEAVEAAEEHMLVKFGIRQVEGLIAEHVRAVQDLTGSLAWDPGLEAPREGRGLQGGGEVDCDKIGPGAQSAGLAAAPGPGPAEGDYYGPGSKMGDTESEAVTTAWEPGGRGGDCGEVRGTTTEGDS
jgi:hypothetical protein